MKNLEAIPATIEKFESMAGYMRVVIDTQENLSKETVGDLYDLRQKPGWFFFAPADGFDELKDKVKSLTSDDLPEIHLEEGEKSPSQRLRAVLYIWWQQNGKKDDFELFYRRWMERTIDQIKEQLS